MAVVAPVRASCHGSSSATPAQRVFTPDPRWAGPFRNSRRRCPPSSSGRVPGGSCAPVEWFCREPDSRARPPSGVFSYASLGGRPFHAQGDKRR
jgi:hypothetical protein